MQYSIDDLRLFRFRKIVVEGQTKQAIADSFSHGALAWPAAEFPAHLGEMQREIMKNGQNTARFEVRDQRLPGIERRHHDIKHVKRLLAVFRNARNLDVMVASPVAEIGVIEIPD